MTSKATFHNKVSAIAQALEKKKQRIINHERAAQDKKNKKFLATEVPKQLPLIKKRILDAAKAGECYIDLFPTGALGDTLLTLLGPGFRADTDTQRYVGGGDGQGSYEGPHISHTRLIWSK